MSPLSPPRELHPCEYALYIKFAPNILYLYVISILDYSCADSQGHSRSLELC